MTGAHAGLADGSPYPFAAIAMVSRERAGSERPEAS